MFDILSNHKIVNLKSLASQAISAADAPSAGGVDTGIETVRGHYERSLRGLLMVEVTDVNSTGTLTLLFKDKALRDTNFDTLYTFDAIDAAGNYHFAVKDFYQIVKLTGTVASAAVVWGAKLITFDMARRPAKQVDSTLMTGTMTAGR